VGPWNSRTTYKDIANRVSKFGGILFTPIQLTAVACYATGPLKVRLSFRSQNVPPPPPKPLHKHRYVRRHLVTVHFSQLTYTVLTPLALTITCSGLFCMHYSNDDLVIFGIFSQSCDITDAAAGVLMNIIQVFTLHLALLWFGMSGIINKETGCHIAVILVI
jgi:hypothetical protein